MAETDAPFLTPHPHRGRRNDPSNLPWTVRALAELRGVGEAELAATVAANAARVFRFAEQPSATGQTLRSP